MDITNLDPERFKNLMATLTPAEQQTMIQILKEYAETGESPTYRDVWLEDYEEIPVDIDTFLEDPEYLGGATNLGQQIYPFWRDRLRELFAGGDMEFEEVAFSGAIGIGKTAIAVYAISYLLYRLLCLRNPQRYFGFADTDEIAIFFFNATVALAASVGYARLHAACLNSPWFLSHGRAAGSDDNPYYIPGKHIAIKAGSKSSHGLGQQIFCLRGDTQIVTAAGIKKLEDLAGTSPSVLQWMGGKWAFTTAPVMRTRFARDTIKITLENGSVIEGTPDHKLMLKDGTYKEMQYLTDEDELFSEPAWPRHPGVKS